MARDFDDFPNYDPIVDKQVYLSNIWQNAFATFIETLQEYLTQYGIDVPRVTTEQRDSLVGVKNGRIIYNTTLEKFQGRENGAWVNFV